jgi:hypothetical protein
MIAPWLLIASLAGLAIQAPGTGRITGTIRDVYGYPIPGATVAVVGENTPKEVISDLAGAFRFPELPAGDYSIRVTLAGFRSRVEQITVRRDRPTVPLEITLSVAPVAGIVWVVSPKPVADAAVIAHIRIVRTAPPAPCGHTVTIFHEVEVVASLKGSPERRVMMAQEGAGVCTDDDGRRFEGLERPYRAGEEYLVFLRADAGWYGRLGGPSLTFPVVDGRVTTRGFAGLPAEVTTAAFLDAVKRSM